MLEPWWRRASRPGSVGEQCVSENTGNELSTCDLDIAVPEDEYDPSDAEEEEREERRDDDRERGERLLDDIAVRQLERSITEDAQQTIAEGVLPGPAVTETICEPTGEDTGPIQRYDCLAVNEESGGTSSGYGYNGTINPDSGNLSWELSG